MNKLRSALRDYGWFAALAAALFAIVWSTYVLNPVKEAEQHIAEPIAQAVGVVSAQCPGGWSSDSARDEHQRVLACARDGWRVILFPSGEPSHALKPEDASQDFVFWCDESTTRTECPDGALIRVPGWPYD